MAKTDYVLRETATNLRRNFTLTLASVLTVAVSLALLGAFLLVRNAVDNATTQWQGGIEFIVYMNPDASAEQNAAIAERLDSSPEIERVTFVNKEAAYEEFKDIFSDSPDLIDSVTPEVLPPSYRVVPVNTDAAVVEALSAQFESEPGVREVVRASETIQTVQDVSGRAQFILFVAAVLLLVAAGLLILNTIHMAIMARRRDIEVMKLVGATNWFIRIPFMLEGLVHGLLGAGLGIGGTWVVKRVFDEWVSAENLSFFQNFAVDSAEVWSISILLLVLGAAIGAVGSGVAVTRYLDV